MDFVVGLLAGTGGVGSFLSRKGPPDNMGRSGFIQPLAYAINSGNVSAARDWLNNYTDNDGTVPVALQVAFFAFNCRKYRKRNRPCCS